MWKRRKMEDLALLLQAALGARRDASISASSAP